MSASTTTSIKPALKSLTDPTPHDRMTARVIEVGETTAGIAVPEHGGVRFYSSERGFDTLDGTLFRSFEQATRAARERSRPGARSARQPLLQAV
ncbi:hypothetical protein GGR33_000290 [Methylobacterium brachythecii]|uniref:Uncharacterized protein n=1 Tax=Methylobacterium brachythecii TaxID=1176177 RepID=A0A7W6AG20_9HYPH|nr:hypothetical protein [Methylobacterium brachythecii]